MKITHIETLLAKNVAAVRVRTDDGAEGIGQTSPYYADGSVDVLHKALAPFFLGQNPWDLAVIEDRAIRQHHKIRGPFLFRAMCGLDTAIWDLLGKVTEQPVCSTTASNRFADYVVAAIEFLQSTKLR